jgi:hypothetical protein
MVPHLLSSLDFGTESNLYEVNKGREVLLPPKGISMSFLDDPLSIKS